MSRLARNNAADGSDGSGDDVLRGTGLGADFGDVAVVGDIVGDGEIFDDVVVGGGGGDDVIVVGGGVAAVFGGGLGREVRCDAAKAITPTATAATNSSVPLLPPLLLPPLLLPPLARVVP